MRISEGKRKPLADQLAGMSQDEVDDWTEKVMKEITDRHIVALAMCGWAIVMTTGLPPGQWPFNTEIVFHPSWRWRFNSKKTGLSCPDWCVDFPPIGATIDVSELPLEVRLRLATAKREAAAAKRKGANVTALKPKDPPDGTA
jgi:hypothetical protein